MKDSVRRSTVWLGGTEVGQTLPWSCVWAKELLWKQQKSVGVYQSTFHATLANHMVHQFDKLVEW